MTRIAVCIVILATFAFPLACDAETPGRIVSLAPNVTEILFALGLGDRIAGVTTFCDYPEEAKRKPNVGGISNPSLERLVALKPDMVIVSTDGNPKVFAERVRSHGIPTFVFRARTLRELPSAIRELGSALGVPERADHLAQNIGLALSTRFARHSPASQGKKVLFVIWPEPLIVAGPGTAIDDAMKLLGYRNIAADSRSPYPKYAVEQVILQSPDAIFFGKGHRDMEPLSRGLLKKLSGVTAVKDRHVFFVSDRLYRLGPRVVEGIEELAACLE